MGLLAPASAVCHFEVIGNLPAESKYQVISEQLQNDCFRSIDNSVDEYSCGWVEFDDHDATSFSEERQLCREQSLCFSLREDRRKIPSALLKREIKRLSDSFLAAHPNFNRVPKQEREAIRDQASSLLFARTLPVPSIADIIWDTDSGLLRFSSLSQKKIDCFQGLFHQSFPDLRLCLLTPISRARQVVTPEQTTRLEALNQASSESPLAEIEANTWLGEDFLSWLLYRSLNSDSRYKVNTQGPLLAKQPFSAWLDNRLLLLGTGPEGEQKISVAGPQDRFAEACSALCNGKQITEATLHMSLGDDLNWKLTLKGERFSFGGFRTPMIKPEKDPEDDPAAEAEAAFYTKLAAIEEGEQLFSSLLKFFLEQRLSETWTATEKNIAACFNKVQEN